MHDVDSYGSWEPSTGDLDGLEAGLAHVSELTIPGGVVAKPSLTPNLPQTFLYYSVMYE